MKQFGKKYLIFGLVSSSFDFIVFELMNTRGMATWPIFPTRRVGGIVENTLGMAK